VLPVLQGDRASGSVGITTTIESLPLADAAGMAAGTGVAVGDGAGCAAAWDDWAADGAWVGAMPMASAAAVGWASGWEGASAWAWACDAAAGAGAWVGLAVEPQPTTNARVSVVTSMRKHRKLNLDFSMGRHPPECGSFKVVILPA